MTAHNLDYAEFWNEKSCAVTDRAYSAEALRAEFSEEECHPPLYRSAGVMTGGRNHPRGAKFELAKLDGDQKIHQTLCSTLAIAA